MLAGSQAACGGASTSKHAISGASPTAASFGSTASRGDYLNADGDNETDDRATNSDDTVFLEQFGKEAPAAERAAISLLVKRYYADAASGDGAQACSLLAPSLVAGLSERSEGEGCAATVSRLFAAQGRRLQADDVTTMVVVDVRVKGRLGLVVVGFKNTLLGEILIKREASLWKLDGLFDSVMP